MSLIRILADRTGPERWKWLWAELELDYFIDKTTELIMQKSSSERDSGKLETAVVLKLNSEKSVALTGSEAHGPLED